MKKYFRVYLKLLRINFSLLFVYRANFVNNVLSSITWGLLIIISILLLTSRTPILFGWTRNEILLLTSIFSTGVGFFHFFFARNFDRLSRLVNSGQLDAILLRPIDAQFLTTTSLINFIQIIRIILGIVLTVYFAFQLHLDFKISIVFPTIMLMVFGLILLYSLWLLIISLTIWFTRLSNLVDLMFILTGIMRYPREMYQNLPQLVFFLILPLTFIMVVPTKVLLEKSTIEDILGLILFTSLFFFASRKFWKFALKYYSGASS